MSSRFNCSQPSLFAVYRLTVQMVLDDLARFFAFDATYTEGWATANFAFTKTVERMPDANARKEAVAILSLDYDKKVAAIVLLAKYLKAYIERGFEASVQDIMLTSAGFGYLKKVKEGNANAVSSFMSSALVFVVDKAVILTEKGKMPADFLARLQVADTDFDTVLSQYNAAVLVAKAKTDERLAGCNEIADRLQAILADGRTINLESPDIAKTYQFSSVLARVESTKNAGINGKVSLPGGKKGLAGATVTEPISGKTYVSDKDGYYEITPLTMGDYTLTFSADGFVPQTLTGNTVQTGVVKRLNVEMVATAASAKS